MKISLRQLEIFCAIVDTGSTAAAARVVSLSQSATSGALVELESMLDAALFDRVGKRLLINDNGRALLQHARHLLTVARNVESHFQRKQDRTRELRIIASTTIGTYLLPRLLAHYCRQHSLLPRVGIANTAEVVRAVSTFEAEVGFIEGPCHAPDLVPEFWMMDELIIAAAPGHALGFRSSMEKVNAERLARERWLMREPGSGTRAAVESALLPHLPGLRECAQFGSSEAVKAACAAGMGLACLSRAVVADLLALGKLAEVNTALPTIERPFYIVVNRKCPLSDTLGEFIAYCHAWAKAVEPSAAAG